MIELYYILLGVTLIVIGLGMRAARVWWRGVAPTPLKRGDLVIEPSRPHVVYEVLSHARPGFVAVRRPGIAWGDPWYRPHPILVVDPSALRRVR